MQVYVHYPYCATLCPYCDFFSTVAPEDARYARTVLRELALWSRHSAGPVTSLYFGGGTPGRMSPQLCRQLVEAVAQHWGLAPGAEVTMEVNPDDVTEAGLHAFLEAGVNRVSIGLQSLDDEALIWLGRRHDAAAGRRAVGAARRAGVHNLSVDMIFGLPQQTMAELDEQLDAVLALEPEHLSLYGLTIEPGTRFGEAFRRGELVELPRDLWLAMYARVAERVGAAGLERYEVSNFARPGFSSRHNRAYWRDRNFVAVGPGAHGQRQLADGSLERRINPRSLGAWVDAVEKWSKHTNFLGNDDAGERLEGGQWLREACMVGLRDLQAGIDPEGWSFVLGLADPALLASLRRMIATGALSSDAPHCVQPGAIHRIDALAEALLNA